MWWLLLAFVGGLEGAAAAGIAPGSLRHKVAVGATPTPSPPPVPAHDFRPFETDVLPRWLAMFRASGVADPHAFSFLPFERNTSTLYGATDVLNVRYITNTLNLTVAETDAYAAHINAFQNATGFFDTLPQEHLAGFQPWHATGYATSALLLLDRNAARPNLYYQALAANRTSWNATFVPLVEGPYPVAGVGGSCDSVHSCAHKLVAVPAVLLMANRTPAATLAPFLDWWFGMMSAHVDAGTGEWCPPQQKAQKVSACLGAGMAGHCLYNAAGRPWPRTAEVRDFALGLQNDSAAGAVPGLWADTLGNWLNLDGVFQAARAANATGGPGALGAHVRPACDAFLGVAAAGLNSPAVVLDPLGLAKDSHGLPGVVTAVAECAKWFPDLVATLRPWRQGIDKGPYP